MKYFFFLPFSLFITCTNTAELNQRFDSKVEKEQDVKIVLESNVIQVPAVVPYHREPETPSHAALQAISAIDVQQLRRERKFDEKRQKTDTYYLQDTLFTGWSFQIFDDTNHKYRYTKYEDGAPVWQIGYFDNGVLDHDFHLKNGKTLGSEKMWRRNGDPYIDYFYSAADQMDGLQRRWHANRVLARQGLYKAGTLVYEVIYDPGGKVTSSKGAVPKELGESN